MALTHLSTIGYEHGLLDELAATLSGRVTLLCYERNPDECHRSAVVAALAGRVGLGFTHLAVATGQ